MRVELSSYRGAVAGLVAGLLALSACNAGASGIAAAGDDDGVPLAELDLGGTPPVAVALSGSDDVIVTTGRSFTVRAEGPDAVTALLRFTRDDAGLGIGRVRGGGNVNGAAKVYVTLPAVNHLALSGSGNLASDTLSGTAGVTIGGSGNVTVRQVRAEALKVALAGSGAFAGSGTAGTLDLSIQGSGSADMPRLQVSRASVSLSGSGRAAFASDGQVNASIAGSGNVRVRGTASCNESRAGSGRLTCTP